MAASILDVKITVLAFASAADSLGDRRLELELETGLSLRELLDRLEERFPNLAPLRDRLAVAVNGKLASHDEILTDGAEVALLPPVSGGQSERAVQLVSGPIDPGKLESDDPACGAEVIFLGRVRNHSQGRGVTGINYEGYEPMAEDRLQAICADLGQAGVQLRIIHRLGEVPAGELSVAIAARAPHRAEAFAACSEALERLKRETPIWKLERYVDGSVAWREEESLTAPGNPSTA